MYRLTDLTNILSRNISAFHALDDTWYMIYTSTVCLLVPFRSLTKKIKCCDLVRSLLQILMDVRQLVERRNYAALMLRVRAK